MKARLEDKKYETACMVSTILYLIFLTYKCWYFLYFLCSANILVARNIVSFLND